MRKFTVTAAVLGLAALGLTAPATTAQASESAVAGPGCDSKWGPRNGNVYAWDGFDCQGTQLVATPGNSSNWGSANDRASSVMNRGFTGTLSIVAFYFLENYAGGHACLQPGELYADNLSDNFFSTGPTVNDNIRSHRWVNGGCAVNLT
ncbi:peptidase inhibitor family I36 protein [Streptomyces sp. NPDC013433]|uniref:peptidase inhibitor family I36 protein n=1 Tax=Streptomyces sp. NPDC013433 TaxID=3155604 RepID=UPI00345585D0